jgi:hypothetical protein
VRTLSICVLLLAAFSAAAAGCGSDNNSSTGTTASARTTTSTATGTGTVTAPAEAGSGTGAAAASAATPASLKRQFGMIEFLSPSHNLGCALSKQYARCDASKWTWKLPPQPHSCEFDWGGSVNVSGKDPGQLGCVSDSTLGATQVLAYGTYAQLGKLRCTSQSTGVSCLNRSTGHGFFISRETYRVF